MKLTLISDEANSLYFILFLIPAIIKIVAAMFNDSYNFLLIGLLYCLLIILLLAIRKSYFFYVNNQFNKKIDYEINKTYDDIIEQIKLFQETHCDKIMATILSETEFQQKFYVYPYFRFKYFVPHHLSMKTRKFHFIDDSYINDTRNMNKLFDKLKDYPHFHLYSNFEREHYNDHQKEISLRLTIKK